MGIQRDPSALVDAVGGYLDEGYVRIKIKIKPGRDVDDTAAVRGAFGGIPLQVDANSAYTLADADVLAELDRFDLLLIEQPPCRRTTSSITPLWRSDCRRRCASTNRSSRPKPPPTPSLWTRHP